MNNIATNFVLYRNTTLQCKLIVLQYLPQNSSIASIPYYLTVNWDTTFIPRSDALHRGRLHLRCGDHFQSHRKILRDLPDTFPQYESPGRLLVPLGRYSPGQMESCAGGVAAYQGCETDWHAALFNEAGGLYRDSTQSNPVRQVFDSKRGENSMWTIIKQFQMKVITLEMISFVKLMGFFAQNSYKVKLINSVLGKYLV